MMIWRLGWIATGWYKENDEFILLFKSSWCKIASAAKNWINSVPQTAATTFGFSSLYVRISFFCMHTVCSGVLHGTPWGGGPGALRRAQQPAGLSQLHPPPEEHHCGLPTRYTHHQKSIIVDTQPGTPTTRRASLWTPYQVKGIILYKSQFKVRMIVFCFVFRT